MKVSTVLLLAGTLSGLGVAMADDLQVAKATQPVFAQIDRNADQRISKTEAGPYKTIIDRFALIDTSGDGFITIDELNANLTANSASK